jgi:hypothetical protein
MVPLVGVPETIRRGLAPYREVFCRAEGFDHISRYVTGVGSAPVTCEAPRKRWKNKRAFAPITRYRDTAVFPVPVVFQRWRYAVRDSPQASVLLAVRPLSYAVISTLRTLPRCTRDR